MTGAVDVRGPPEEGNGKFPSRGTVFRLTCSRADVE